MHAPQKILANKITKLFLIIIKTISLNVFFTAGVSSPVLLRGRDAGLLIERRASIPGKGYKIKRYAIQHRFTNGQIIKLILAGYVIASQHARCRPFYISREARHQAEMFGEETEGRKKY